MESCSGPLPFALLSVAPLCLVTLFCAPHSLSVELLSVCSVAVIRAGACVVVLFVASHAHFVRARSVQGSEAQSEFVAWPSTRRTNTQASGSR